MLLQDYHCLQIYILHAPGGKYLLCLSISQAYSYEAAQRVVILKLTLTLKVGVTKHRTGHTGPK